MPGKVMTQRLEREKTSESERPEAIGLPATKSTSQTAVRKPAQGETAWSIVDPKSASVPVFVHSSFRTSSTWLWKKLRETPYTMAYCEVFHEAFVSLSSDNVRNTNPGAWRSKHPPAAPYFLEYFPLLNGSGGVKNYEPGMAYETFIPADGIDGHLSVGEQRYLESLISHSVNNNCIPVLTCTRTLGRSKAIRKAFACKSIFLHRNIFHQWASYSSQVSTGNPYFFEAMDRTLAGARHDPFMRLLGDWFGTRESLGGAQLFQLFLLMHLYLYAHAYDAADIVIDVSALAEDKDLRQSIEDKLSSVVCHRVDLSDAHSDFGQSDFNVASVPNFIDTIDQFSKLISGSGVSGDSVAFVDRMKLHALEEWRRHEFFTREVREANQARRKDADCALKESQASSDAASAERDVVTVKLAEMKIARDGLQHALSATEAERDDFAAKFAETAIARDGLQQTVAAITAERDDVTAKLAETATTLDGLQHAGAAIAAERDEAAAKLAETTTMRDELQQAVVSISAERDEAAAKLAATITAWDELQHAFAATTAERDQAATKLTEMTTAWDASQSVVAHLTDKLNRLENDGLMSKYFRSLSRRRIRE